MVLVKKTLQLFGSLSERWAKTLRMLRVALFLYADNLGMISPFPTWTLLLCTNMNSNIGAIVFWALYHGLKLKMSKPKVILNGYSGLNRNIDLQTGLKH